MLKLVCYQQNSKIKQGGRHNWRERLYYFVLYYLEAAVCLIYINVTISSLNIKSYSLNKSQLVY